MFRRLGDVHDGQSDFDDAEALGHRHVIPRMKIPRRLRIKPAGNGHHPLQRRRQRAARTFAGQHADVHRRHVKERGLVFRGRVQNALGQIIGVDHDRGADFEIKDDGHVKVIGHRQHPENFVFARQTQPGIGGARAFQHVSMRQHHALGLRRSFPK